MHGATIKKTHTLLRKLQENVLSSERNNPPYPRTKTASNALDYTSQKAEFYHIELGSFECCNRSG
jgi:hypothetical protein